MASQATSLLDRLAAHGLARRTLLFASVAALIGSIAFAIHGVAHSRSSPVRPLVASATVDITTPLATSFATSIAPSSVAS